MGYLMIVTWFLVVLIQMGGATSSTGTTGSQDIVEVLRCFKTLQESGKRIYVSYIGNMMRLFDAGGVELSCNDDIQQQLRQKSDRRCLFSPIHCLFNKRIQAAKMMAQLQNMQSGGKLYAVRRRR